MKKNLNFRVVLPALFLLSSCGTVLFLDFSRIHLGMTKQEVRDALHWRPDNIVSAKRDSADNGLIEVVQYSNSNRFWLYFKNDSLIEWHIVLERSTNMQVDMNVKKE